VDEVERRTRQLRSDAQAREEGYALSDSTFAEALVDDVPDTFA
jgi:hypothetical protein